MDTKSQQWTLSRGKEKVVLSWRSFFRGLGALVTGKRLLRVVSPVKHEQARMKLLQEKMIDSHDMYVQRRKIQIILKLWRYGTTNFRSRIWREADLGVRHSWGDLFFCFWIWPHAYIQVTVSLSQIRVELGGKAVSCRGEGSTGISYWVRTTSFQTLNRA